MPGALLVLLLAGPAQGELPPPDPVVVVAEQAWPRAVSTVPAVGLLTCACTPVGLLIAFAGGLSLPGVLAGGMTMGALAGLVGGLVVAPFWGDSIYDWGPYWGVVIGAALGGLAGAPIYINTVGNAEGLVYPPIAISVGAAVGAAVGVGVAMWTGNEPDPDRVRPRRRPMSTPLQTEVPAMPF